MNCPVYRASDEAAIFPADNVAAVIEVKSSLNKEQLISAFDTIAATKSLVKTPPPKGPFLVQTQTFGCVFAFESSITLAKAANHYADLIRERGIGHHIDLIVVLDVGIITLAARPPRAAGWSPCLLEGVGGKEAEGAHFGFGAGAVGRDALDSFVRLLLPHLAFFRGLVDHPGFNWEKTESKGQVLVQYVWSHTNERDPRRKKERLEQYKQEVEQAFRESGTGLLPPE
jgi:hypothetical protein